MIPARRSLSMLFCPEVKSALCESRPHVADACLVQAWAGKRRRVELTCLQDNESVSAR